MYGIFLSQQDQAKVKRRQPQHGEGRATRPDEVHRVLEDLAINSRKSGGSVSSRDSFSTITTVESTRIQSIKSSDHSSKYSRYVPSEITFTTSTPSIVEEGPSSDQIPRQQQQQQQQQRQQQKQRSSRAKPGSSAPKSTFVSELDDFCLELSQEVSKSRRSADFYRKAAYAKRPSRKSSAAATSRRQVTDDGDDCAQAPGRVVSIDS